MASHSESVDFSRPYEAYEELDLNDDDNTQSKNTSPFSSSSNNNDFNTAHQHQHQHDPWQSSSRAQSYSSTFSQPSSSSVPPASSSRFSPSESVGSSSPITMTSGSGSVGGMPGVDTKGKAASRSGTSSGSVSGGKSRTSWDVPLVLGVAVVDFNHLVSNLSAISYAWVICCVPYYSRYYISAAGVVSAEVPDRSNSRVRPSPKPSRSDQRRRLAQSLVAISGPTGWRSLGMSSVLLSSCADLHQEQV